MSNNIVGNAYRDIIEDVINSSRIDFEDSGVDETTLRELQLLWQERLTMAGVAVFPWDPEPLPEPDTGNGVAVNYEMSSPPLYAAGGVPISATPQAFSNPAMAAMRAAQHIQEFAREERVPAEIADESIKGVMKRAGLDDAGDLDSSNGGGGLMLPGGGRIAQVDGNSEEPDLQREAVDRLLELHILRQRNGKSVPAEDQSLPPNVAIRKNKRSKKIEFILSQVDGALDSSDDDDSDDDDDDDIANVGGAGSGAGRRNNNAGDDSDAINSDLDDPDDEINSQDDEENEDSGMIMLCLYDKVTRTKNKWKCVLKDGVVNVNGKDYLFGKGTGEYEW
ncbi:transcription factor IIA, alpha/beta subunit [Lipomyces tetrasporus]|uniref:Transcription factor IIA, alpha/beta subunit n=1 Tax=Lipomyces tetrasporus TaxID=54092 RepID=A0AAD7QQM0_9ASCO|nr:transcription factor IIA, alpha/beta subunit [Lipomyces tetrasporus]KAJ8099614.1 transcription factor IIA, alpha/beta subunit [Lipomyces tetrasporus]